MPSPCPEERVIELAELGDRFAPLRLFEPSALEAMRRSLVRHGQLSPLSVFADGAQLELIDGFKRVHAARALGQRTLRATIADVDVIEAKVLLMALHDKRGLTELEEGWLIRSLYRDDGLSQPAIAHRLGRHKSWVCRRLLLVEALDPAVQANVRLGLLAARAAVVVSQLPRGNQAAAAELVNRRGLTVRQTELLVGELLDCPDDAARAEQIFRRMNGPAVVPRKEASRSRAVRTEADWISADIHTLGKIAPRLQARLHATPLCTFGPETAFLLADSLGALATVLSALHHTVVRVCGASSSDRKELS